MMIKYNSQSAKIQDKELLTGLESKVTNNELKNCFCSYNELKRLFDTSSPSGDGEAWYGEQLEKKCVDVSEIIQILRSTNVKQCKGQYYDDGKYCAAAAVLHGEYGWDGDWIVRIPNRELVSIFHGGILKTILDLNDRDTKSFSEIADALEKRYLADRI